MKKILFTFSMFLRYLLNSNKNEYKSKHFKTKWVLFHFYFYEEVPRRTGFLPLCTPVQASLAMSYLEDEWRAYYKGFSIQVAQDYNIKTYVGLFCKLYMY